MLTVHNCNACQAGTGTTVVEIVFPKHCNFSVLSLLASHEELKGPRRKMQAEIIS